MSLKVLHCVRSLHTSDGGPARSVPALAAGEACCGADVRVWSSEAATIDLNEYDSVQFVSGEIRIAVSADWTPDVIHDHGLWLPSNHACAKLANRLNIPRVVSPRGMLEPWCLKHRRMRKQVAWHLYQRRDLKKSACLHGTSDSEIRQFRKLGFQQPIIQLPNGVPFSNEQLSDTTISESESRQVLYLSRIHPVKGLLNLIEAWGFSRKPGWKLTIIGSDEDGHRSELQTAIDRLRLTGSVTIKDAIHSAEKWTIMRNADVMVLPSFSENFGIVVAEALSVGTPVITTTGTPWRKIVSERCGWYVQPTVEGLNEALSAAMATPRAELDKMGTRGYHWVRREFVWSDIGRKMLSAYAWLLGETDTDDMAFIHQMSQRHAA